jgi:hypothetical protein
MTQTPEEEYIAGVVEMANALKAAADALAESLGRVYAQVFSDDGTPPAPVSDEVAPDTEGLPS